MKPIKPKKMSKALEKTLHIRAGGSVQGAVLSRAAVRSILAALEYERQRWQESQEKLAERNLGLMALARKYGWSDVDKEIASARVANHVADHIAERAKLEGVNSVVRGTPASDEHHVHLQVRGFDVVTPKQQHAETEEEAP